MSVPVNASARQCLLPYAGKLSARLYVWLVWLR